MAEHRTLQVSFFTDDDTVALGDRAFRVLVMLKGMLPTSGLGEVRLWELCASCRCTPAELEDALAELEAPKPSGEDGWIRREGRVLWLVTGLKHARLNANDRNTRAFIARVVADVRPCALVDDFRRTYAEFFPSDDGRESGGGPNPPRRGSDNTVDGRAKSVSEADSGAETPSRARGVVPDESTSPGTSPPDGTAPPLPADPLSLREPWLTRYYAAATPKRRADVERQLAALLTPKGVPVKGRGTAVATPETLERAFAATLVDGAVKIADRAIVVLLSKLVSGRVNETRPPGLPDDHASAPTTRGGGSCVPIGRFFDQGLGGPTPNLGAQRSAAADRPACHDDACESTAPPTAPASTSPAIAWINEQPALLAELEARADRHAHDINPNWRHLKGLSGLRARKLEEWIEDAWRAHVDEQELAHV